MTGKASAMIMGKLEQSPFSQKLSFPSYEANRQRGRYRLEPPRCNSQIRTKWATGFEHTKGDMDELAHDSADNGFAVLPVGLEPVTEGLDGRRAARR